MQLLSEGFTGCSGNIREQAVLRRPRSAANGSGRTFWGILKQVIKQYNFYSHRELLNLSSGNPKAQEEHMLEAGDTDRRLSIINLLHRSFLREELNCEQNFVKSEADFE